MSSVFWKANVLIEVLIFLDWVVEELDRCTL